AGEEGFKGAVIHVGKTVTVLFTSCWRLVTGPTQLSACYRDTTAGSVPHLSQLRVASRQLALATVRYNPRDGFSQALAAAHTRPGRRTDRSGVEPERGAQLSGASVAAATRRLMTWQCR